ncbi:MAG TPA: hypothetical protein VIK21_05025 [Desulfuromonadaceae bacterium]
MGGSNLSDDAITELNSRFEGSYLYYFACSPFNRSGMAYYVTSFDNHVLSSSDSVNNNYFSNPDAGRLNGVLAPFMTLGIFTSCLAISGLILHLDAFLIPHSAVFAELPAMVEDLT